MPARPSLRSVPADRRTQMEAIRRREDDALVAASNAEAALHVAEERLAQLVTSHQAAIDAARIQLGETYREVVEAFGSRSRAAEYLNITPAQLKSVVATAPDSGGSAEATVEGEAS